jgi:uncharacterized protein (TIGR02757 family)
MKFSTYKDIAERVECERLAREDIVHFARDCKDYKDKEIAAIIVSWLSDGEKEEKEYAISDVILNKMGGKPYDYIMSGDYTIYKDNYYCLHRMITYNEFANLCEKLHSIYVRGITLQDAMLEEKRRNGYGHYVTALASLLSGDTMIATAHIGANYRLNLAIRWLVRQDSPVDMGLWLQCSPSKLLVSVNATTLQNIKKYAILRSCDCNEATVISLTQFAKKIFPNDAARLDYVLNYNWFTNGSK